MLQLTLALAVLTVQPSDVTRELTSSTDWGPPGWPVIATAGAPCCLRIGL